MCSLRCVQDVPSHTGEHDPVEGRDGPPVNLSGQSVRDEDRALPVHRLGIFACFDAEFQPGASRNAHFGAQPQQVPVAEFFDPPPIECVAGAQSVGVPSAAAQT